MAPKRNAICELAVVPMRKEPSDKSEMVNQVLFGELMEIVNENEKWFQVELVHDHYQGWVDKKQISVLSFPNEKKENLVITSPLMAVRNWTQGFTFLPAGALIQLKDENTLSTGLSEFTATPEEIKNATTKADIALASMMFLDTPYLWGGRTLMGIDCSGFTQVVFRMSGIFIPRDAYQQAELGETITFVEEALTGDLAFFENNEGRITHVGIILSQKDSAIKNIIHASGKVRIDKLDHQGIFNEETKQYSHHLRIIKRFRA